MGYQNQTMLWITFSVLLTLLTNRSIAQLSFDLESGIVTTGYNDLRIPGQGGTFIALGDELSSSAKPFVRVRGGYRVGSRGEILALYAPLSFAYSGSVQRAITFQGATFGAGEELTASYMFNSYRATYRYYFKTNKNLTIALGLTAKIRHALISIENSQGLRADKPDVGFVPIVNFHLHWQPLNRFGLMLDGDALAAPQGRAEDVLIAITYRPTERTQLKTGYRILEGGADNAIVYTFSMFHYWVFGVSFVL